MNGQQYKNTTTATLDTDWLNDDPFMSIQNMDEGDIDGDIQKHVFANSITDVGGKTGGRRKGDTIDDDHSSSSSSSNDDVSSTNNSDSDGESPIPSPTPLASVIQKSGKGKKENKKQNVGDFLDLSVSSYNSSALYTHPTNDDHTFDEIVSSSCFEGSDREESKRREWRDVPKKHGTDAKTMIPESRRGGGGGGVDNMMEDPKQFCRPRRKIMNYGTTLSEVNNVFFFEKIALYGILLLFYGLVTVFVCMGVFDWLPTIDMYFTLYMFLFLGIFFSVSVTCGVLVRHCKVSVTNTRKTIHCFSFFLPFTLFYIIPFQKTLTTYILTFFISFLAYVPLIETFRNHRQSLFGRLMHYAFISFERKEDRPFTLLWAVSQSLMTFLVMTPVGIVLAKVFGAPQFTLIPIITVAIGDGLAEPMGRRFGYHKYMTTAIWTNKEYTRSIEGSMCVFCSCILAIILATMVIHPGTWDTVQVLVAFILIPVSMTFTEAVAPHSWDNALMLLVGGGETLFVFSIPFIIEFYHTYKKVEDK
jgi:dolichol kinase